MPFFAFSLPHLIAPNLTLPIPITKQLILQTQISLFLPPRSRIIHLQSRHDTIRLTD